MSVGRIIETPACVAEGAAWLAARDPRLAAALAQCGPLPLRRRADGFAALADAILGQQVSTASARAIAARMAAAGLDRPRGHRRGQRRRSCAPPACRGRRPAICRALAEARARLGGAARAPRRGGDLDAGGAARDRPLDRRDLCDVRARPRRCLRPRRPGAAGGGAADLRAARAAGRAGAARDGRGLVALAGGGGAAFVVLLPSRQGSRGGGDEPQVEGRAPRPRSRDRRRLRWCSCTAMAPTGPTCWGSPMRSAPHLKDTVFRAPDAHEQCRGNPYGWQWFPIPWMDGSSAEAMAESYARSKADLHAYLDRVLAEEAAAGRAAGAGRLQPGHDDGAAGGARARAAGGLHRRLFGPRDRRRGAGRRRGPTRRCC